MLQRSLSFHPKLAAGFDLLLGVGLLMLLRSVGTVGALLAWFTVRVAVWALLIYGLVYYPPRLKRWQHLVTTALFALGSVVLLLFLERGVMWYAVSGVVAVAPAVSFWLIPAATDNDLSFVIKPYRRWRFLMTVFALAGLWSGVQALLVFQLVGAFSWWFTLLGALLSAGIALWWWHEYDITFNRRMIAALAVLFLIIFELGLMALFSSLGYAAVGLMLAWVWYVLWLMFRFFLSSDGLKIKKQLPFLIVNGILIIAYMLFIVRWR